MKDNFSISDLNGNYNDDNTRELKDVLSHYSTNSAFSDLTWYMDKLYTTGKNQAVFNLYFTQCPGKYVDLLKYFAAILLSEKYFTVLSVQKIVNGSTLFCKYLRDFHNTIPLKKVTKFIIAEYVSFLDKNYSYEYRIKCYRAIKVFFDTMRNFLDLPQESPMLPVNPFPRLRNNIVNNPKKMIPKYVLDQMDVVFKDGSIPLSIRLAYWLMRSIPSRVSEIMAMEINCILPAMRKNSVIIKIPTWKQNGGYLAPESRLIEIKQEGHGAYLLGLIEEQREFALEHQNKIKKENKGLLFVHRVQYMVGPNEFHLKKNVKLVHSKRWVTLNAASIRTNFNNICVRRNIVSEEGYKYLFVTHQLRHVGITDRIYEGFELNEIREITNHKSNEMLIRNYVHVDSNKLKEKQENIFMSMGLQPEEKVLYKGTIINSSRQEKNILNNPRAGRLGKIGLCSDMLGCSNPSECLQCANFIPDLEQKDYFLEQLRLWQRKIKIFEKNPIWKKHALNNINAFQDVIDRINTIMESE